ncbi:coproporphyrinogen III oxidase [Planctomycetes bacterium Pla163]|uniref:Coproporphyrinogen III oxidase n=1 Tax=Rohdeia mirabilis TaxID=2528008 RepID=A0A518D1R2_9BACT|nr:coproporphyrinogen III oxidase [Planctomycetes bacterium Pla163]
MKPDWRFAPLRPWLERTYGRPLHRVALDAGSTCPNRDGSKGYGGCVYCDVEGSGTGALRSGSDIGAQLEAGIARVARRDPGDFGVIAYFQSYSNTYVAPERLDEVLGVLEARLTDPIDVVAISTRPDTLPEWALARLARLAERVPVWLELGLECADDAVLDRIQRLHTVAEFEDAVARARAAGLLVVGHAILGLPGDGRDGARRTAEVLARSGCEGVKVHHLMVLRRTILERWWKDGQVELLEPDTYVDWLADFVERLGPDQVLHRLTGDAPPTEQLAPRWTVHKSAIRERLMRELERRGTRQGSLAPA